jgi:hypothetical protein
MFPELVEFFKLHGHCNVPIDWQANPELARWVAHQRLAKRQSRLTADQLRQMDEIGFAWTVHNGMGCHVCEVGGTAPTNAQRQTTQCSIKS